MIEKWMFVNDGRFSWCTCCIKSSLEINRVVSLIRYNSLATGVLPPSGEVSAPGFCHSLYIDRV